MKNVGSRVWILIDNSLRWITFKILKRNLSDKTWEGLMQFLKFGIVGLSNTVIGYLIYAVSLKILRFGKWFPKTDIFVAQLIMFFLSVLWSFYWNDKAVFKPGEGEKRNIFAALVKTYISYAFTSLFLSELLLYVWVDRLNVSEYIAPIFNLIITVPLNFFMQKLWAFRRR